MQKSLLASLVALALTPMAFAQTPSEFVFFGDSLSDSGFYSPTLQAMGVSGRAFTTNPDQVWTENLAQAYGTTATPNDGNTQTGNNYAAGGARAGVDVATGLGTAPSVQTQVANYLRNHQTNSNTFYVMEVGGNDLLAATGTADLMTAATAAAQAVNTLHQAGAEYIIVGNVPDAGLTPSNKSSPTQSAAATSGANFYNNYLFYQLKNSGANVIPLNFFKLIQEVSANPNQFGFTDVDNMACDTTVTATSNSLTCTRANLVTPTANEDYLFADGLHPTGKGHQVMAQYAQSVLAAPQKVSALGVAALNGSAMRNEQIFRHLNQATPQAQHNVWVDGVIGTQYTNDSRNSGSSPALMVGADLVHHEQNAKTGLYLHRQTQKNHGNELTQTGFGAYHAQQWDNQVFLQAQLGYDHLKAQTQRTVQLGSAQYHHEADATGHLFSAAVRVGKRFQTGAFSFAPFVGLNAQRVLLGEMVEDQGTLSTAMRFEAQSRNAIVSEVGLDTQWNLNDQHAVFAGLTAKHQFGGNNEKIYAALQTIDNTFYLPAAQTSKNQLAISLGYRGQILPTVSLQAGVQLSSGKNGARNAFMGVNKAF